MGAFTQKTQQDEKQKAIHVPQETLQQQKIHDHLIGLQNWDGSEGTLQEKQERQQALLLGRDITVNAQLMENLDAQLPQVLAEHTADGEPQHVYEPPLRTYKQRQERKRQNTIAKQHNPNADHVTYEIATRLEQNHAERVNSFTPEREQQADAAHVDRAALLLFVNGYKKTNKGVPEDAHQDALRKLDNAFLDDYLSCNWERRASHLDRITEELLTMSSFYGRMLQSDDTMRRIMPIDKLKNFVDRCAYYDKIMKDPINAPYFERLPQLQRDLIESRILSKYAIYGATLDAYFASKYYNGNSGDYIKPAEQAKVESAWRTLPGYREMLPRYEGQSRQKEQIALERQLNEEIETTKQATKRKYADNPDDPARWQAFQKAGGYLPKKAAPILSSCQYAITKYPDAYIANQQAVDRVYQELYRTLDTLESMRDAQEACQSLLFKHRTRFKATSWEDIPPASKIYDDLLADQIESKMRTLVQDAQRMDGEVSMMGHLLRAILMGADLTEEEKPTLAAIGFADLVKQLEASRSGAPADGAEDIVDVEAVMEKMEAENIVDLEQEMERLESEEILDVEEEMEKLAAEDVVDLEDLMAEQETGEIVDIEEEMEEEQTVAQPLHETKTEQTGQPQAAPKTIEMEEPQWEEEIVDIEDEMQEEQTVEHKETKTENAKPEEAEPFQAEPSQEEERAAPVQAPLKEEDIVDIE